MRSPLRKRILRDLTHDFVKYLAIFLFMVVTIGFVSGFLVAARNLQIEYDNSFENYNIEDGHFVFGGKPTEKLLQQVESHDIHIYENAYCDLDIIGEGDELKGTFRVFHLRNDVNLVDLLEGDIPVETGQIAVDRLFANNNGLSIGDCINLEGTDYTITGIVALSDYSTLYKNNNDMMFDSVKFGVGIITQEAFDRLGDNKLNYSYAWKYDKKPASDKEERDIADDLATDIAMDALEENTELKTFIPVYANNAISYAGDDIGGDRPMMETLLYILIAIIAFVFAVTTDHTIVKEANVIGTLRASGYTKAEIFRHYLASPMIVTVLAAIIGNVMGYTLFEDVAASMYRGSYSLTHYVSYFNTEAFIKTTLIPLAIMCVVNSIAIVRKLSLSPIRFLRRDISKHKKSKAVRLPGFTFFNRFRLRVIIQNIPGYITMFIGILFAGMLLMYGLVMMPLLDNYTENALKYKPCDYQYILKIKQEVNPEIAEKYCVTSLKMIDDFYDPEDISIYGIIEDSRYFKDMELPENGVVITSDMAEKYRLDEGAIINLKEEFGTKIYAFQVKKIVEYKSNLGIYMSRKNWCETFTDLIAEQSDADDKMDIVLNQITGEKQKLNYYNGYFSDTKLDGVYLRDDNVATKITDDDLTQVSRQMEVSMGEMFSMLNVFSLVLFALLIFLLTKLILENNTTAISMTKILGYSDWEIARLYLVSTIWVVVISALLSMVINTALFKVILRVFMKGYGGWFELVISPFMYVKMFVLMILTYLVVAVFQFFRIKKISMEDALKNVE